MASCGDSLTPQVARRIGREVAEMIKSPPEGITILPNESDISDVQAIIYGPAGTPYAGGQFRVKLVLSRDFPTSPPSGFFLTRIFHPNVSQKGEICVNTLKKDWKPEYGVKHILLIIKCLLIVPNPESALNEEAAKLLLEHYDEYYARAQMVTEIHAQQTYNEKENCQDSGGDAANACTGKHGSAPSSSAPGKNTQGSNHKATLALSKTVNKDKKRLKRL